MTTPSAPADTAPAARRPASSDARSAPAPPSWPLAAVAGVLVLVTGIAGGIVHIGAFFVPALVVLAVGAVKLWREQR